MRQQQFSTQTISPALILLTNVPQVLNLGDQEVASISTLRTLVTRLAALMLLIAAMKISRIPVASLYALEAQALVMHPQLYKGAICPPWISGLVLVTILTAYNCSHGMPEIWAAAQEGIR